MYIQGEGRGGKVTPSEVISVAAAIVATQDTSRDVDKHSLPNTTVSEEGFRTRDSSQSFELAVIVYEYEYATRLSRIIAAVTSTGILRAVIEAKDLDEPRNSREVWATARTIEIFRGTRPNIKEASKFSDQDVLIMNKVLTSVLGPKTNSQLETI